MKRIRFRVEHVETLVGVPYVSEGDISLGRNKEMNNRMELVWSVGHKLTSETYSTNTVKLRKFLKKVLEKLESDAEPKVKYKSKKVTK